MRAFLIVATSLVSLLAQSAPRVTSVRLYVFDCGVLVRGEPTAYGLTKDQVGDTNFADACYLVAHPKGTLLWDVGIIPDAQITPGGVSIAVGAPRRGQSSVSGIERPGPCEANSLKSDTGLPTSRFSLSRTVTAITSPTRTITRNRRGSCRNPSAT